MYSTFSIAKKYLWYQLSASNGKGHGIHSPFVFAFIEKVLNGKSAKVPFANIETQRTALLHNKNEIEGVDFGAGSGALKFRKKRIDQIAKHSLKSKKWATLLHRMAVYFSANHIVELGTSLGITTCYLAKANADSKIYTFEGDPSLSAVAKNVFSSLQIDNVQQVMGNFDITLPEFLKNGPKLDFVFIDGNHQKEPTIRYFHQLLPRIHNDSILIFDDIHWSKEMEQAWLEIKEHPAVTLSIDLFYFGIVFFKTDFKVKQHFTIRF